MERLEPHWNSEGTGRVKELGVSGREHAGEDSSRWLELPLEKGGVGEEAEARSSGQPIRTVGLIFRVRGNLKEL